MIIIFTRKLSYRIKEGGGMGWNGTYTFLLDCKEENLC